MIYSQDFESAAVGNTTLSDVGFGFGGANIFLGPDLGFQTTATDGAGGTKGFTASFNGTNHTQYFVGVYTSNSNASDASPLAGGTVTSASQIRFSMDVKTTGSISSQPIEIRVFQNDLNYEARNGVDANGDGDMTDFATAFDSDFKPTVVDGAGYQHVSFT